MPNYDFWYAFFNDYYDSKLRTYIVDTYPETPKPADPNKPIRVKDLFPVPEYKVECKITFDSFEEFRKYLSKNGPIEVINISIDTDPISPYIVKLIVTCYDMKKLDKFDLFAYIRSMAADDEDFFMDDLLSKLEQKFGLEFNGDTYFDDIITLLELAIHLDRNG